MTIKEVCNECKGELIVVDFETTCKSCGLVVDEGINMGLEFSSAEKNAAQRRTGEPHSYLNPFGLYPTRIKK